MQQMGAEHDAAADVVADQCGVRQPPVGDELGEGRRLSGDGGADAGVGRESPKPSRSQTCTVQCSASRGKTLRHR